jgi:hypothetical protein
VLLVGGACSGSYGFFAVFAGAFAAEDFWPLSGAGFVGAGFAGIVGFRLWIPFKLLGSATGLSGN